MSDGRVLGDVKKFFTTHANYNGRPLIYTGL